MPLINEHNRENHSMIDSSRDEKKGGNNMKIVGIAACTSGIAHTYIAKEKIVRAAEELGFEAHIETQGTIGTEDELTAEQIAQADVALIAADIKVGGKDRFKGLPTVEVPTEAVIKAPKKLLLTIEKKVMK